MILLRPTILNCPKFFDSGRVVGVHYGGRRDLLRDWLQLVLLFVSRRLVRRFVSLVLAGVEDLLADFVGALHSREHLRGRVVVRELGLGL